MIDDLDKLCRSTIDYIKLIHSGNEMECFAAGINYSQSFMIHKVRFKEFFGSKNAHNLEYVFSDGSTLLYRMSFSHIVQTDFNHIVQTNYSLLRHEIKDVDRCEEEIIEVIMTIN